ncbi:hypothetical protein FS837_001676 [Tulasnella sp. UAMH 9824]|nr:hypothetical protein FS837_001676 [Tulasnella sp. UAMH 9824]
MAPTLISSEAVFNIAHIAVGFAPVPGLQAAVQLVEMIYRSAEGVPLHRGKCRDLAIDAVEVMTIIRDNAGKAERSNLDAAVQDTIKTLEAIKEDVDTWRELSVWRSWYLRHDIEKALNRYEVRLRECVPRLGLAGVLQINTTTQSIKEGREQDTLKLDELAKSQQRLEEAVKKLHEDLKHQPPGSAKRAEFETELFKLRQDEVKTGQLGISPAELEGECVKVGSKAVRAGHVYDIWKGLWLGQTLVALKFYRDFREPDHRDEKHMERFERQVNLWRTLNHPNVLPLYGWCYIDGDIHLVSPWLNNMDVRVFLSQNNLSDQRKLRIAADVVQGLRYLHSIQVFHGDVQPSNVLISDDGHGVLGDFALAKALEAKDDLPLNTQSNTDLQSMRYQAPEITDNVGMTPAVDIYSWAMTTLEIVSGRLPYPRYRNIGALTMAIVGRKELPKISDHPSSAFTTYPQLWPLFETCWKRAPAARPTAAALLQTLEAMISQ